MSNPHHNDFWRSLNNSALLRFLLFFASGWVVVQLIDYFYNVIAMFVTAAILAVLMDFPVRKLSPYMPRWSAITLVAVGTIAFAIGFITLIGFQILTQGKNLLDSITNTIQTTNLPFKEYLQQINFEQISQVLQSSLSTGLGIVSSVFSNTFTAVFLFVIAVYMLIDGKNIWTTCLRLIPKDVRGRFDQSIQKNFSGFLRAQVTLVAFLSGVSFVMYTLLGVQFSLILAIVIGVLDAIPGIGATLGVVVVSTLVFLTQGHWMALKVIVISVVLQQIQDNYVSPRVMGKELAINPVLLFFALFVGERLAGLLGIFLAVPIAGMIVSWLKENEESEAAIEPLPLSNEENKSAE